MRFRSEAALALFLLATPVAAQEVNCAEAVTQIELTFCAEQAWLRADEDLNLAWSLAVEQARAIQSALPADAPVDIEEDLRRAQRVWIDFRDLACAAESHMAWGGSMAPMLVYACRERLTRQRTADLRLFGEVN
ncbi:hypothetical protein DRV85_05325 [Rhodosalinus halophilus]|uniref:Lysozyme inhibitor LprI-like N-terminal domain-containing protein n=1 Tax=Rhodosalinus halophilus TaxID=2259333 RepID=A0A365UAK4_9RHOB|nr:lysozyme inhibitor LprI family protein [Rhodosalinus halophilus]RBI86179.1 hypothetical protein DRV85_05325 [Rhodosalinus halophilus]